MIGIRLKKVKRLQEMSTLSLLLEYSRVQKSEKGICQHNFSVATRKFDMKTN